MNFKVKMAIILSLGLILGLFGGFLRGMEPSSIIDAQGVKFELNEAQKVALAQCGTLKNLLADTQEPLNFEGQNIPAFVTRANLANVAAFINSTIPVSQISDEKSIEFFKLANYLHAPRETLERLAERAYPVICKQIENLNPGADTELYKTIAFHLPYYPDFNAFWAENKKKINNCLVRLEDGKFALNLDHIMLKHRSDIHKKLHSLDGVEQLASYPWADKIRVLRVDGHHISSFDLKKLKKTFPNLINFSIEDNALAHVANAINASNIYINMRRNPIQTLCIENPGCLDGVQVDMHPPANPVQFKQTLFGKLATWFKAFGTQATTPLRSPISKEVILGSACGSGLLVSLVHFFWNRSCYQAFIKQMYFNILHPTHSMSIRPLQFQSSCLDINSENPLYPLVIDACFGALSDLCIVYGKEAIGTQLGFGHAYQHRLQEIVHNPLRVSVHIPQPNDENNFINSYFPSNYAYNLFGKN